MQYNFSELPTSGSRVISGASLAQTLRHLSPSARACWGADIVDGITIITAPTMKSIALNVGVSASYLFAALRLTPEQRNEVKRGLRPLIPLRQPASPTSIPTVEDVWAATDFAGHLAFTLRHAGELLAMLDTATAPASDSNIVIEDMLAAA
jgi:hypothetical protein